MKSHLPHTLLPVALGWMAGASLCLAQPAQIPKVGEAAPLVSGKTERGETWRLADAFGVRSPGRNVARRVSFLIGKDGRIAHVTDSPQADIHLGEMKEAVAKLKKS